MQQIAQNAEVSIATCPEMFTAKGTLNINHWEKLYHMDFMNKTIMENGGVF
jgi:hypothetical protein